jgi:hypothetical protein
MVGPAGKKNKKEWRLAGGPGKRKREVGVEIEESRWRVDFGL